MIVLIVYNNFGQERRFQTRRDLIKESRLPTVGPTFKKCQASKTAGSPKRPQPRATMGRDIVSLEKNKVSTRGVFEEENEPQGIT